jgi:hypothetical protein
MGPVENQVRLEISTQPYSGCIKEDREEGKEKPLLQRNRDNLAHCMQSVTFLFA